MIFACLKQNCLLTVGKSAENNYTTVCGRKGFLSNSQASAQRCDFTESQHNSHRIATEVLKIAGMDIDALHSTLLSITVLSEKLRIAREELVAPERTRSEIQAFLHEVDRDLRIAKATLAGELGFGFCPRCWPPELVAADLDGQINCPVCGQVSHEQAA